MHFHSWNKIYLNEVPKESIGFNDDSNYIYRMCRKCGEIQRQYCGNPFGGSYGWVTIKMGSNALRCEAANIHFRKSHCMRESGHDGSHCWSS